MKKILIATILLAGCVGSATPHNPMGFRGYRCGNFDINSDQPWWQQDTRGMTQENNPWEAFNQPVESPDPLNPWSNSPHFYPSAPEPVAPEESPEETPEEETGEIEETDEVQSWVHGETDITRLS